MLKHKQHYCQLKCKHVVMLMCFTGVTVAVVYANDDYVLTSFDSVRAMSIVALGCLK
jgi:hypothetical protein